MSEEAVRELKERLPHVSEKVIRHFLSKSVSVEECFEHLKNSATSYADPMSPQDQYYTPYPGNHSNGSSHTVQRHTSYPAHSTPPHSHYQAQHSDDYIDTQWGREGIPHRAPPSPLVSHRTPGGNTPGFFDDGSTTTPLRDLITAQEQAIEDIHKVRDFHVSELSKLKNNIQILKEELSDLRLKVSLEGSTRESLANTEDLITTIRFDISEKKKKITIWKSQVDMKSTRDMYTEDGVRWQCSACGFLNHPLLPSCENCYDSKR